MKASHTVGARRGGSLLALVCALTDLAACSTHPAERATVERASPAAASASGMVVQIEPDAGVFLPASENIAVPRPGLARDALPLMIERDASGGRMVRLRGRFSGVMRAELSDGVLRSECESASASSEGTP